MNRLARVVLSRGNARLNTSACSLWSKSVLSKATGVSYNRSSLSTPFRLSKRYLSTSRPLLSSSAATSSSSTAVEEQKEEKGLFGQWPYYPLVGLGLISAISKEVLILNDELVYLSMFGAFTTTLYIYVGEDVKKFFEDKITAQRNTLLECCEIAIDSAKRYITIEKRNKSFPDDLKTLYEEEKRMAAITVDYQNKKHQIDVRDAVLQKLSTVRALEDEESNEYKKALQTYAMEYVREKFSHLSPAERSSQIDQLIDALPTNKGSAVFEDMIASYFNEFLAQQYSPAELGVSSRVPTFLTKEAAAAKSSH